MGLRPILSSLLRNSAGALLVAIQIALTLAIVVNAVFVTSERLTKMGRPSGIDDQNQFAVPVTGFEKNFDFFAMVRGDMAMLRDMPGVVDATPINQIPLSGGGSSTMFYSLPDKKGENSPVAYYGIDDHAVNTLGVKLAGGRNFAATEVDYRPKDVQGFPGTAVVTRAFAVALFPKEKDKLVGKTFYDDQGKPVVIAGVIEQMHGAWVGWDKVDRVMLTPVVGPGPGTRYLIRTQPGQLDAVMTAVETALRKRDPNRVVDGGHSVGGHGSRAGVQRARHLRPRHLQREYPDATDRHPARGRRAQAGHRQLLHGRELDGHLARRTGWLRHGAGGGVLALEPVRVAAPQSVLPRRWGRGPLGAGTTGCVATRPAGRQGVTRHGHSKRLVRQCPVLATLSPRPASYV